MDELKEQIKKLKIPYPEKLLLAVEAEEHLQRISPQSSAESSNLSTEEILEFYKIHNNLLFKFLDHLSPKIRGYLEFTTMGMPMVGLLIFLEKENFMLQFIKEGGFGMLPILLLGVALTARELSSFFRLVILKDHSQNNLRIDSSSVLIGGVSMLALGFGGSALGIYISANASLADQAPILLFLEGLKESMGPIIVSSCFSAFIFILHFTTRRLMSLWKAPIPN